MKMNIFLLLLLSVLACNSQKNAVEQVDENGTAIKKLQINKKSDAIDKQQMYFKIKNIKVKDGILSARLDYGGGCVKNHIFEIESNGKVSEEGVLPIYILHKTEDNCKMMIMENRSFDISKFYNKKKVKAIQINHGEVILLKK